MLAKAKRLRGTRFDPFGYAHVRRTERALLAHYTAVIEQVVADLCAGSYDRAVRIAELPDMVRGYEDVKLRSVEQYRARLEELGVDVDF